MDAIRLLAAIFTASLLGGSAWAQFQPSSFEPARQPAEQARTDQRFGQLPNRIVKNLRDFMIPFQLATQSSDVSEVHLHVSVDQGKQWQLYKRQAPSASGFPFRATKDGEYWFAVRTIGREQDLRPPSQLDLKPELIVVVDTELPRLSMRVQQADGKAIAEWLVSDDHLDASSFRLQFEDQNGVWQDVPFTKIGATDLRTQWQGQAQWWLRQRGPEVTVRAEVSDRAGNSQVVSKQISIQGASPTGAFDFDARDQVTAARRSSSPVGQSWESFQENARRRLTSLVGGGQQPAPGQELGNTQSWGDQEPTVEDFAARKDRQREGIPPIRESTPITRPVAQRTDPRYQPPTDFVPRVGSEPSADQNRRRNRFQDRRISDLTQNQPRRSQSGYAPTRPAQSSVNQPVAQRRPFASQPTDPSDDGVFHPRITSTPNFELVYDLYGVDANGQRQVELWYTRDRKRSWELYGADVDGQSPMDVNLKSQGLYGFQLTVDTGIGEAPEPPQSGDDADVWVLVDWTKPTAQIGRVEMPDGVASQEITVEWAAHDDTLLADAPITLSYSDSPNGPWIPFARDIPNSGAYYWRVDRRLPERLYIQLEVRDMVGNVTSDIYDGAAGPGVRIRDVRF